MSKEYIKKVRSVSMKLLKTEKIEPTEHQKKVFGTLSSGEFGCKNHLAVDFASAFMQFDFKQLKNLHAGQILVPIKDYNSYKEGIPTCVIVNGNGFQLYDDFGAGSNSLENREVFRSATKEEVDHFYKTVDENDTIQRRFTEFMQTHSNIK